MKSWMKPEVVEIACGMEINSYASAELTRYPQSRIAVQAAYSDYHKSDALVEE